MEKSIVLKAGPQEYRHSPGILQNLPIFLEERNMKKVIVLHGERSLHAAKPYFPSLKDFQVLFVKYNGECSISEINRICEIAQSYGANGLIGIGGGKVVDLAKAVAARLQLPEILIPTLASNCASFSAVSIIYNDEGIHVDSLSFPKATNLVLIEPEIILNSPIEYTIAGIGDTLAKWYEGIVRLDQVANKTVPMQLSYQMMEKSRDLLFQYGEQSIKDAESKKLTDAFVAVIDTNLAVAGLVGGFGSLFAKSVGAHAFFNAATAIPRTNNVLHGFLVSYGVLIQLALENKQSEIKYLFPFYRKIGLPTKLSDLYLSVNQKENLQLIAKKMTKPSSRIHSLPFSVTPEKALHAIYQVEEIITSIK
ncbi:iron-containing alcohol dehydrogenase family protein [Priestia megaterium]|uniref:iron-containing alcohol dehydrogenase family protein n=1 Tax=Priestia megaterium TaxID=1404 RepID=UPI002FFF39E3